MNEQIVTFDYAEFIAAYPEFARMTEDQLQNYFDIATGILSNRIGVVVCCKDKLKRMLYLLTAHVAFLFNRGAGTTGVMSSATEGSVSVGFAVPQNLNNAWFNQSQYGQLFWQLAKPYMMGRYICGCGC